jgi:hypothetical protein
MHRAGASLPMIGGSLEDTQGNVRLSTPSRIIPYADTVTNLRVGIAGHGWSLTGYVETFDENYYTGTQENFGLGGLRIRPHFRTMRINVRIFTP